MLIEIYPDISSSRKTRFNTVKARFGARIVNCPEPQLIATADNFTEAEQKELQDLWGLSLEDRIINLEKNLDTVAKATNVEIAPVKK